jgi:DNA mismatch endonuclease (patch repair protein)
MDLFSAKIRSQIMSSIRSRNTKPEIIVRHFLHSKGYRYSLHSKKLPGTPDIALNKLKISIFINGCFWHGHARCKYSKLPETNVSFWKNKINQNRKRDKTVYNRLNLAGWHYIIIWACALKNKEKIAECQNKLLNDIANIAKEQRLRLSSTLALKTGAQQRKIKGKRKAAAGKIEKKGLQIQKHKDEDRRRRKNIH